MSFSFQNCLRGSYRGSDVGRDHGRVIFPQQELFLQGNYVRVRRGGWTSSTSPPGSVGRGLPIDFQHFGLDQESLTSLEATSPAGCRRPGAGNTVTQTLTLLSPTTLTGWGRGRLQDRETVLPAQVCTKPLTPDGHRSGEGTLHFNISKRHCSFPRSSLSCIHNTSQAHLFISPQKMLFNANPDGLQI